jgi:nicotinamide riboside kinase
MERRGQLAFDDLLIIAREQVAREEAALRQARRFLFCDTSPLTTLFYSREMFARADPELVAFAERHYDHIVLCAPDFPFVQDGTRQGAEFRARQHAWYLRELERRSLPYLPATGSMVERIASIRASLNRVF